MLNHFEKRHQRQVASELDQIVSSKSIKVLRYRIPELTEARAEAKSASLIGLGNFAQYKGLVLLKILPSNSGLSRYSFEQRNKRSSTICQILWEANIPTIRLLEADFQADIPWALWTSVPNKIIGDLAYRVEYLSDGFATYLVKLRQVLDKINEKNLPEGLYKETNIQTKIREEYILRQGAIISTLGEEIYEKGLAAIENTWASNRDLKLVHNDLSPQNLLENDTGFVAIDWESATLAPAEVDWATVWIFACLKPDWAQQIYLRATNHLSPTAKSEANKIFLTYGYRILAYYAETYLYAQRMKNRHIANNKLVLQAGQQLIESLENTSTP